MRLLLTACSMLALVAAAGCGDDTTSGAADMTMSADLHAPAGDMAKLNCGQLLKCVSACTSQTCAGMCIAAASSTAAGKAQTLATCIFGHCGPVDGGSGMCTSPTDSSNACTQCEAAAVGATGQGPCGPAYAACQADM